MPLAIVTLALSSGICMDGKTNQIRVLKLPISIVCTLACVTSFKPTFAFLEMSDLVLLTLGLVTIDLLKCNGQ